MVQCHWQMAAAPRATRIVYRQGHNNTLNDAPISITLNPPNKVFAALIPISITLNPPNKVFAALIPISITLNPPNKVVAALIHVSKATGIHCLPAVSVAEVQFRTDPENQNRQYRTESSVLFCSGSLISLLSSV